MKSLKRALLNSAARLIELNQDHRDRTDKQMAQSLGYDTVDEREPGVRRRVLVVKVEALARSLELAQGMVTHKVMEEKDPELLNEIERCIGPATLKSGEMHLIDGLRTAANGRDHMPTLYDGAEIVAYVVA